MVMEVKDEKNDINMKEQKNDQKKEEKKEGRLCQQEKEEAHGHDICRKCQHIPKMTSDAGFKKFTRIPSATRAETGEGI